MRDQPHTHHPATAEDVTGWAAVLNTWRAPGRLSGLLIAAAPTLVFVLVNALGGLTPALIAAALSALAAFVYRLLTRQSQRSALAGLGIVAVCAVVAARTGEARGFFLVPAMIPFAVLLTSLVTVILRRPLTGLLLNRVTGGPREWWRVPGLLRVHLIATGAAILINLVNAVIQVVFYRADNTAVLAAAHIATGPLFATLVAVTVLFARRHRPLQPDGSPVRLE